MDVRVGLWRKLSTEGLMLLNSGVGEDSWESLGLQGDPTPPVHSKGDQSWVFFGRNDAKAETPILWAPRAKSWLIGKDWCWEGLGAGGERDDRGWDSWIASPTWWMWVWVNSRSWWWTGRPGMLRFMGSQSDTTERLNWTELKAKSGFRVLGKNFRATSTVSWEELTVELCTDESEVPPGSPCPWVLPPSSEAMGWWRKGQCWWKKSCGLHLGETTAAALLTSLEK